jgi:hypothetical protein
MSPEINPGLVKEAVMSGRPLLAVFVVASSFVARPAGAADPRPILLVHLVNNGAVPAGVLEQAEREAAKLYRHIDVELVWTKNDVAEANSLIVHIVPTQGRLEVGGKPLGLVPRVTEDGETRYAYVFYDRVAEICDGYRLPCGPILAAVIAHEMGHLLLPHGSHSPSGLMRAQWTDQDLQDARCNYLRFTRLQGDLIRARLKDQSTR